MPPHIAAVRQRPTSETLASALAVLDEARQRDGSPSASVGRLAGCLPLIEEISCQIVEADRDLKGHPQHEYLSGAIVTLLGVVTHVGEQLCTILQGTIPDESSSD